MTDIHEAVREVLRVRDAEREDKASTEDLLDAIAGLEGAKCPPSYQSDLDEVLFTIDLALHQLSTVRAKPAQASGPVDAAAIGLTGSLDYYCPESEALRALRWKMREMGYDMLSPMMKDQQEYHFCIMAEEVATLKPFITAVIEDEDVITVGTAGGTALTNCYAPFAVTIRPSNDTDEQGYPLTDVIVKRVPRPTTNEAVAA